MVEINPSPQDAFLIPLTQSKTQNTEYLKNMNILLSFSTLLMQSLKEC